MVNVISIVVVSSMVNVISIVAVSSIVNPSSKVTTGSTVLDRFSVVKNDSCTQTCYTIIMVDCVS